MKLKLLAFSAMLMSGNSLYAQSKNFVLNGKIKELKDGEQVMLLYRKPKGVDTISSAVVKNGSFTLEGSVANPTYMKLHVPNREEVPLFIENATMSISGDSLVLAKIRGSKANDEFESFQQSMKPILKKMLKVGQLGRLAYELKDQVKIDKMQASIDALEGQRLQLARSFAFANPNSFVSPVIILTNVRSIDPSDYLAIYEKFSPEVKACDAAKSMKFRLDGVSHLQVGSIAPVLTAKTPN